MVLCPEAQEPVPWDQSGGGAGGIKGGGTVYNCWSGYWQTSSPVWRDGGLAGGQHGETGRN